MQDDHKTEDNTKPCLKVILFRLVLCDISMINSVNLMISKFVDIGFEICCALGEGINKLSMTTASTVQLWAVGFIQSGPAKVRPTYIFDGKICLHR